MKYQVCRPLTPIEFAMLKADIAQNGVLIPIEVDENGDILDGHHRVQAWEELRAEGVDLPQYAKFIRQGMTEEQKRNYARKLNVLRRQMSKEEREQIMVDMRRDGASYRKIADATGVDPMTVYHAVKNAGVEISTPVNGADGKTYPAQQQAKPEPPTTLFDPGESAKLDPKAATEAAKQIRKEQQQERKAEKRQAAQNLPDKVYNVIYIDPPWEYNNTGVHGAANHHYDTMPLDQLEVLPQTINLQIAKDAVLFLWITNPLMAEAYYLIERWGFTYKTNMVWIKTELQKPGSGFYWRGQHEILFLGVRGSFTPLDEHIAPPIGSWLMAPIREHSRKPDEVYSIVERLYPQCNYVELFARGQRRPGWDAWGNEVAA